MRFALSTAEPSAASIASAAALARAAPDPDALVIVADAAQHEATAPVGPVVRLAECYDRHGGFLPIRLGRRIDEAVAADPAMVVLDGSEVPLLTIDSLGNRTNEVPHHFMRRFYWRGPRPEVVVHFVPGPFLLYFARDWARLLHYPPSESTRSSAHDDATRHIAQMVAEMDALRSKYHPWDKFKRTLRARLAFWRR